MSGGGLYSTLTDLQKFGQMLINKGELNARNYTWGANGSVMEYGQGFNVYSKNTLLSPGSYSHEGSGSCGLFMDHQENRVFACFCPLAEGIDWEPEDMPPPSPE